MHTLLHWDKKIMQKRYCHRKNYDTWYPRRIYFRTRICRFCKKYRWWTIVPFHRSSHAIQRFICYFILLMAMKIYITSKSTENSERSLTRLILANNLSSITTNSILNKYITHEIISFVRGTWHDNVSKDNMNGITGLPAGSRFTMRMIARRYFVNTSRRMW